jgi:DNA-binding NarL/FixJ family response regulator
LFAAPLDGGAWMLSFDVHLPALTPSEREVVALLLRGASNREIADARGTTLRTVGKQVDAIYKKLGVHSRSELASRLG